MFKKRVVWPKGHTGSIILNVDGSALTNPGAARFGGLIRDHNGKFIKGYYGSIGYSNVLHAEIMTLFHGIQLCWEAGFKDIISYSDSLQTIRLVQTADVRYHHYGNEIIRQFLAKD